MYIAPIVRGDSVSFKVPLIGSFQGRAINPVEWTCSISFRGAGNSLNAISDSNWFFNLAAIETNTLKVGTAYYQITLNKISDSEKITIDSGRVEIKENFSSVDDTFDARSQNRKDLEQVQSLIRQIATSGGVAEYAIGNRRVRKYDLAELRALESQLLIRVNREERSEKMNAGLGDPFSKYVRFS